MKEQRPHNNSLQNGGSMLRFKICCENRELRQAPKTFYHFKMTRIFLFWIVFLAWIGCSNPTSSNSPTALSDSTIIKDTAITTAVSKLTAPIPLSNQKMDDTTFILREMTKTFYHAIYIEKNRQSKFYQRLTNFSFNKYDKESFEMNYNSIKEKFTNKLKKFNRSGLPTEWVPLYRYKDKYYLYAPSDWGNAGRRIITDSTLVYWYMDGPYPMPLTSFRKVNDNKYNLTSFTLQNTENGSNQLIIHIIDGKNKIAVWESPTEVKEYCYTIYVPKENAKNFDMIVNYCEEMKQMEFDFDTIDYKKLLNTH